VEGLQKWLGRTSFIALNVEQDGMLELQTLFFWFLQRSVQKAFLVTHHKMLSILRRIHEEEKFHLNSHDCAY
jgi:hypothetical protein